MAITQSDIDAIDRAIASGELEVSYADRRVRYRSIAELKNARKLMINQLSAESEEGRPQRQYRVNVSKGI